jgi:glycosyltransferase involved in cell wall biosynthesis
MRDLGWKVDLIESGPNGRYVLDGVEVLSFSGVDVYLLRHLVFNARVLRYILQNWSSIDVVMFTQISAPWLFLLKLIKPFSRKSPVLVMDTRTVPMETPAQATLRDRLRGSFYNNMNHVANLIADGQTAITQRMADLLRIPPAKMWGTWPSGVNLDTFSVAASKRDWPCNDDPVNIIYIGTLHYERNLMTLGKAIVLANEAGLNFRLLLYGEGTQMKELQSFAAQHPREIGVFDSLPHEQMPGVLARAHVGALPFPDEDKYRVCSPIKLFEYMGSGMPILATRIVCHSDVIGDGQYVFWAEDAGVDGLLDALREIWRGRASLPLMGQKALAASIHWTYKASAERLSDALWHGLSLQHQR